MTSAGSDLVGSPAGEASRPSSTNRPIWAIQPSALGEAADGGPCGRSALPSTSAAR